MFLSAVNRSIDAAVQTIERITDNMQFEILREDLFHSIVSAVHFIADYEERVRVQLTPEDAEVFKAFLSVNNQLKHDVNLEMFYYDVAGSMFPMFFPMRFGEPGVNWRDFPNNGNKNARGKRAHYEKHLMDRDIGVTLKLIKQIIAKYMDKN